MVVANQRVVLRLYGTILPQEQCQGHMVAVEVLDIVTGYEVVNHSNCPYLDKEAQGNPIYQSCHRDDEEGEKELH